MSADAKIWCEPDASGWTGWRGIHDDAETDICWAHKQGGTLSETLQAVETCAGGRPLRWEFCIYPGRKVGLRGFHA